MSFIGIVSVFLVLGFKFVTSASVHAHPNALASSIDESLQTVIDAGYGTNKFNENLTNSLQLETSQSEIDATASVPFNSTNIDGNDADSNDDLKTDSSAWYQYDAYRYYPYYRPSSYDSYYWPYGNRYYPNYPSYDYNYNYYNNYNTGQYYYNPYRPYRPHRPSSYRPPYRYPYKNYYYY